MEGVRLLCQLSDALETAGRPADVMRAALRVLVPALADGALVKLGEGSGEMITAGAFAPTMNDKTIEAELRYRGERIGALHLLRNGEWSDEDLALVSECASRIALTVESRRLGEAAAASTQYDAFLATLSHELRTPLGVIVGWVDLLRTERLTHEKRAQALEIVDRNARAQIRLIDDILEMSRIVQGKMRLELASVPGVDLVLGAVEGMRPQAEAAKVTLDATLGPAFTLRGDAVRLGQVVHNLLTNALRHTPPGGRVHVTLDRQGETAHLAIADDGNGIEPAFLPHVFERFRQGDRRRVAGARGLGLGLFIVRHIVELHGGTVAAASDGKGKGATFTVTLPLGGPG